MSESLDKPIDILPSMAEVLTCQFSTWYPIFSDLGSHPYRRRSNITIKSIILDLPEPSFRAYMNSPSLILPLETRTSSALLEHAATKDVEWSSDEEEDPEDDSTDPKAQFYFPELNNSIDAAIQELGGAVAPKLNWSSPKDAVWVNSSTMECRFAGDVYMLIKASDFCNYDVHHAVTTDVLDAGAAVSDGATAADPQWKLQLALRKWCNLYPSSEFRCFVRDSKLIAISQRHHSQHWPHLEGIRDQMRSVIQDFFDECLQKHIGEKLNRYVFDVYVDKKNRIWLLDINVWASRTDSLLFEWSELSTMQDFEFRVVQTERHVRADPLASYKAPIDTVHCASDGNNAKFQEFMDMCEKPSALSDDDDDH